MKHKAAILAAILLLVASASAGTESILYSFTGGNDGGNPVDLGLLVRDNSGTLYGTTEDGGSCGEGTAFALSSAGVETVLHSFCGTDGASPIAGLIHDSSGTFYGTTFGGGSVGCGTAFKLVGSTLTTLHSFACGSDGGGPFGVVLDKSGNLYGIADLGGTNNNGLVWEVSTSGAYSVIYTFCSLSNCTDGAFPSGGLAMDAAGNLYGTTGNGGTGVSCSLGCGVVFELSQAGNSWNETVIHNFSGSDGQSPAYLIMSDRVIAGKRQFLLFGTAAAGGSGGAGTVFEMSQSKTGFQFTTLHDFTGADGQYLDARLILVNGRIFGTASYSGSGGYGTVFELTHTKQGWKESTLYSFTDGSDGGEPESGVVADPTGNLYGVARFGGSSACYPMGCGVVFEVTP